jgi:EAL domain-containing protein (putative c-di-GMP-specific phosphodiesterase class I)
MSQICRTRAARRTTELARLDLQYLPVIDLVDGDLVGTDLVAHTCGTACPVTAPVVARALGDAPGLLDALPLALPLGPCDLADPRLAVKLAEALDRHLLSTALLTVVVDEADLHHGTLAANVTLSRLRAVGLRVALSGFGAIRHGCAHLIELPIDEVRLHPDLVAEAHQDEAASLISSTVALARAIGLVTAAEAPGSGRVLDALAELGVERAAGGVVSVPLSLDEASAVLAVRSVR